MDQRDPSPFRAQHIREWIQLESPVMESKQLVIFRAVLDNNIEVIRELIQRGVVVSRLEPTNEGFTPLHVATFQGHLEAVKLLIDNGANVNERTVLGFTPLHFACRYGYLKTAHYLVEHGAEVNARNLMGDTPLHFSVARLLQAATYQPAHSSSLEGAAAVSGAGIGGRGGGGVPNLSLPAPTHVLVHLPQRVATEPALQNNAQATSNGSDNVVVPAHLRLSTPVHVERPTVVSSLTETVRGEDPVPHPGGSHVTTSAQAQDESLPYRRSLNTAAGAADSAPNGFRRIRENSPRPHNRVAADLYSVSTYLLSVGAHLDVPSSMFHGTCRDVYAILMRHSSDVAPFYLPYDYVFRLQTYIQETEGYPLQLKCLAAQIVAHNKSHLVQEIKQNIPAYLTGFIDLHLHVDEPRQAEEGFRRRFSHPPPRTEALPLLAEAASGTTV